MIEEDDSSKEERCPKCGSIKKDCYCRNCGHDECYNGVIR